MSITGTSKIFQVEDGEYGYNVGSIKPVPSGHTVNMYIPKIMGAIESTGVETISINNLFDNDSQCRPTFSTRVYKTKSIPVKIKENCNWLDKVTAEGYVPSNSMFIVEFLNGDISSPYATSK